MHFLKWLSALSDFSINWPIASPDCIVVTFTVLFLGKMVEFVELDILGEVEFFFTLWLFLPKNIK